MKNTRPDLRVRVHGIDGSVRTFTQHDPDLVNRTLHELEPAQMFTQNRISVADEREAATFLPPLVTRVDLITDRLSVWDFPFVIGAMLELTEAEFIGQVHGPRRTEHPHLRGDFPMFLDIEMVSGQHAFLRMEIIAGLPAEQLLRIYSLLKERRLIFGLHTCGVGILNLANVARFLVHPELPEATNAVGFARRENGEPRPGLIEIQNHERATNGSSDYEKHFQTQKSFHAH